MQAPIITLTTDWGTKDFFAGMVKGRLYSSIPNVRIADISHNIYPFSLPSAAFVVKHGCLGFPKGTIHIVDVDSVETADRSFIVVEYDDQFFICTDNGLPHAVFGDGCTQIVELNVPQDSEFFTFPALHLFCKVAALIANDTPIASLGRPKEHLTPSTPLNCIVEGNHVVAYIAHIDSYGNAYLNLSYDEFQRICNGRKFSVNVSNRLNERVRVFSDSYLSASSASQPSGLLLTVSATGLLEIAICHDSAEQLLALSVRQKVDIFFE